MENIEESEIVEEPTAFASQNDREKYAYALLSDTRNYFEMLSDAYPSDQELDSIFDDLRKVKLKMMVRLVTNGVLELTRVV